MRAPALREQERRLVLYKFVPLVVVDWMTGCVVYFMSFGTSFIVSNNRGNDGLP